LVQVDTYLTLFAAFAIGHINFSSNVKLWSSRAPRKFRLHQCRIAEDGTLEQASIRHTNICLTPFINTSEKIGQYDTNSFRPTMSFSYVVIISCQPTRINNFLYLQDSTDPNVDY
jgi:hypothetical protein